MGNDERIQRETLYKLMLRTGFTVMRLDVSLLKYHVASFEEDSLVLIINVHKLVFCTS